jgi:GntR family transcriptional regulator
MPDTEDTALWRTIAEELRTDIAREAYPPASPLPGEVALAERYRTSRPTVRRALAELAGEGLITAAHGRGTFVRPRPERRTILTTSRNPYDLLDAEHDPRRAHWDTHEHPDAAHLRATIPGVTGSVITEADRDQAEALGIKTGTPILYRFQYWRHRPTQRTITITSITPARLLGIFPTQDPEPWNTEDDQPHEPDEYEHEDPDEYEDEFDPDDGATPPEPHPDAEPTPLYTQLNNQYGPISFTTTTTARMPRGKEPDELATETGTPLLCIQRTMTDTHGRTLEITTIHAPADRFATVQAPAPDTILTL